MCVLIYVSKSISKIYKTFNIHGTKGLAKNLHITCNIVSNIKNFFSQKHFILTEGSMRSFEIIVRSQKTLYHTFFPPLIISKALVVESMFRHAIVKLILKVIKFAAYKPSLP